MHADGTATANSFAWLYVHPRRKQPKGAGASVAVHSFTSHGEAHSVEYYPLALRMRATTSPESSAYAKAISEVLCAQP